MGGMSARENRSAKRFAEAQAARELPHPKEDANKYTRGKLVFVAGSAHFPGAACLAAAASQRAGAGYTEVVTHERAVPVVQAYRPSLVVCSFDDWRASELSEARAGHPMAVVVGCGFDARDAENDRRVCAVLRHAACPVLVDGTGIATLVSLEARQLLAERESAGRTTVITPHGGEAARLAKFFGIDMTDPAEAARALARNYHCIVVLKGPDTYVADGDRAFAVRLGTAALAKAGTGDVLAGVIGALLAQGADTALDACATGAVLHAVAGNIAAEELTDVSVIAEDLIDYLPDAIAYVEGVAADGNKNA